MKLLSRLLFRQCKKRRSFASFLSSRSQSTHKFSYEHGTSSTPLIGDTIGTFFDAQVNRYANDLALVVKHQNIRWSYEEFQYYINALASGISSLGITAGDRVGIWSPNNAEWATVQFATAKIGAVLVNINPAYRSQELKFVLNRVQCKCLVMAPSMKHSNYIQLYLIEPQLAHDLFFFIDTELRKSSYLLPMSSVFVMSSKIFLFL